jgi:prepilin-type N-terminal cleavage/methylation domain-containing protein
MNRAKNQQLEVSSTHAFPRAAFTLIELLLALAVSSIVLVAIGGVFFSAIRLRERTTALLDESRPVYQALNFLRRDLQGALPPDGLMSWDFKDGAVVSAVGQTVGLQFSTTTGVLNDSEPWGDVQEVTYELRSPQVRSSAGGRDLVRTVTRNMLTTTLLDYREQVLLSKVQTLEFQCYDGIVWRDLWDTSLTETNLPSAVRVRLQLVANEGVDTRNVEPLEMIIPIVSQSRTNVTQQATGGSQ